MKRLVILLWSLFLLNSVYANNTAQLNLNMSGAVKNTYYLCVNNAGCINIDKLKDKIFPIHFGNIIRISITDSSTLKVYPQTLPVSCQIKVNDIHQKILISGKIVKTSPGSLYINDLLCFIK